MCLAAYKLLTTNYKLPYSIILLLQPRLPQRQRPHNLRMPLLQFLQAHHQVKHHEEEDAEEGDEHRVLLVGDARRGTEVGEHAGVERNPGNEPPEDRPETRLPNGLLLATHQIPRVEDRKKSEKGGDDLVGSQVHRGRLYPYRRFRRKTVWGNF